MQHLIRRIALLEALYQPRPVRPCILVRRYHGETTTDALRAEGYDSAGAGGLVIIFRRDHISRDAAQGER